MTIIEIILHAKNEKTDVLNSFGMCEVTIGSIMRSVIIKRTIYRLEVTG